MQYTIVSASDVSRLVQFVNRKMEEGWVPTGGVTTAEEIREPAVKSGEWTKVRMRVTVYLQAMTISVR